VPEPDPEPHAELVPETTPDEFTCKHCVDPVMYPRVRLVPMLAVGTVSKPSPRKLAVVVQPVSVSVAEQPLFAVQKLKPVPAALTSLSCNCVPVGVEFA